MTRILCVLFLIIGWGGQHPLYGEDNFSQKIEGLDNRVTELELKDSLNKIKWSGTLINRYDYLDNKNLDSNAINKLRTFSTFFSLNADFNLSSKLGMYSSLGMSKFWNNEGRHEASAPWNGSQMGSYGLSGSSLKVDRAYMTYRFYPFLSGSLGRMSTNMGPPTEQLDGGARQGTYPRFAYNSIFDGAAIVGNLGHFFLPQEQSLKLRLFYTPFININHYSRTLQIEDPVSHKKVDSSTQQYTSLLEYEHNALPFVDKLTAMYFYYYFKDFYNAGQNWDPATGQDPNEGGSDLIGIENAYAHLLFLSFDGLFHTGLNLSLSYLRMVCSYPNIDIHRQVSNAYLVGLSYKFSSLGNFLIGGEYRKTDKMFYLDEWTYLNLLPFYNTPDAKGYHLYISRPLGNALTARMGYYYLKSKEDPFAGAQYQNNTRMHSVYANLRLDF